VNGILDRLQSADAARTALEQKKGIPVDDLEYESTPDHPDTSETA
jgi:hypothetical protein